MTTINAKSLFFSILLVILSCNYEQRDSYYSGYYEIIDDEYHKKGWLPEIFYIESITNFYSRTELDVNSFLIRFSVERRDLNKIISELDSVDLNFKKPHGIEIPIWWKLNIMKTNTYYYKINNKIWKFAVDKENSTIYCWGDH